MTAPLKREDLSCLQANSKEQPYTRAEPNNLPLYSDMRLCCAPHISKWYTTPLKSLGHVLSCLCDWCTLKDMCGLSEYAQPPYLYPPSVGVVTNDVLSNRKVQGLGTDLTDDDDDMAYTIYGNHICILKSFILLNTSNNYFNKQLNHNTVSVL